MGIEHQKHAEIENLALELEQQLLKIYSSPVLTGDDLRLALGFKTLDALRQAIVRNNLPVPLFSMENRRGKFALVKDVASYLAAMRFKQTSDKGGD